MLNFSNQLISLSNVVFIRGSSSTCLTFTRFKFDRFLTRRNYNGNKFGIELTRTERSGSPSELEYRSIFSDYVRPFVVTTTFHGSHGAAKKKKRKRERQRNDNRRPLVRTVSTDRSVMRETCKSVRHLEPMVGGHCVRVPSYFPLSSVRLISAHLRESRFGKNSLQPVGYSPLLILYTHPGRERERERGACRGRAWRRKLRRAAATFLRSTLTFLRK